jgi:hypothetical protein
LWSMAENVRNSTHLVLEQPVEGVVLDVRLQFLDQPDEIRSELKVARRHVRCFPSQVGVVDRSVVRLRSAKQRPQMDNQSGHPSIPQVGVLPRTLMISAKMIAWVCSFEPIATRLSNGLTVHPSQAVKPWITSKPFSSCCQAGVQIMAVATPTIGLLLLLLRTGRLRSCGRRWCS